MPLDATVQDVISQVIKKTYVVNGLDNYNIIMKRHSITRILGHGELPLLIQKRLLQQVGFFNCRRVSLVKAKGGLNIKNTAGAASPVGLMSHQSKKTENQLWPGPTNQVV